MPHVDHHPANDRAGHPPGRPLWTCEGCSAPWPCASRRGQLLAEHPGDLLPVALYLSACLVEAAHDLPESPAGQLYHRFLGWLPYRPFRVSDL